MARIILLFALYLLLTSCADSDKQPSEKTTQSQEKPESQKPNIIIIYADDLGYGDLSCYGATAVSTPNLDKMAANGIRFTDAHSPHATCTPSRYSLLTGRYGFRRQAGILPGDAPLLIEPGMPTLPSTLQVVGYKTAVVGKWHLGLGRGNINWNEEVKPGPLEIGFDYSFLLPATGDRVPCVYLEGHEVYGLAENDTLKVVYGNENEEENPFDQQTGHTNPELLSQAADIQHSCAIVNGVSRIGYQKGGESAMWDDQELPKVLTQKSMDFMDQQSDNPFFLYLAFHDIHVPRIPNEQFVGATDMGPRGDAIVQMDWCVGQILDYLQEKGIAENTLVIFSSDNGPVLNDGYEDQAVERLGDHTPAGPYRGGKYSVYEGGTRVPTIAYWPGTIQAKESKALWSHTDLFRSLAQIVGAPIAEGGAPDSKALPDVLLGKDETGSETMVEEAFAYAIRQGKWKYILPTETKSDWISKQKNIEGGQSPEPQLYDLEADPKEQTNLATTNKEKAKELEDLLIKTME